MAGELFAHAHLPSPGTGEPANQVIVNVLTVERTYV
jgi:hypothetical protein